MEVNKEIYLDCVFNGKTPFICPTAMVRKDVYKKIDGYNESLKYIEDVDLWWRILDKYNLGIMAEKLINYRFHDKQGSVIYRSNKRTELGPLIKYIQTRLQADHSLHKYNELFQNLFLLIILS